MSFFRWQIGDWFLLTFLLGLCLVLRWVIWESWWAGLEVFMRAVNLW